ncbi:MAG: L-glutamate gamma-semialdehyde dehydrogenase [Candidatus Sumerlaeia bacterium]|nr:L-glutamate gamma-semialdehyde dehydrogenase [Candidatus Sumerlaeia bacterium]
MQVSEFTIEPLTDFSKPENRQAMEQALAKVESMLGREWSLVLGGERVNAKDQFLSHNPSDPDQVIGVFQKATQTEAQRAIEIADRTFETWKRTPAEERAQICFRVADLMRKRKFELSAWMVLEVGKNWAEADADTAEAIDLVEFYGREVLRYAEEQPLVRIPTERNQLRYIPLGVVVVIPPWNFPLAILAGMTTMAWAAGNTVVLKPSSDAPAIAKQYVQIVEEAGLPPGVVNLLTGPGGSIGDFLVGHPRTRMISFTGSKEVGVRINELAARIAPGQRWIKRVIAEMGGKDPIIVDSEADLDAAAQGVMASAFGYSGQKCSACSRAIVDTSVYDELLERLVEKTKRLKIGPAKDPETYIGPVINMAAMARILDYIDMGKREGRLILGGNRIGDHGYFVEPTIIADVDRKATIAQEEIFGPVLAVIRAQDFRDAINIANDSEYGLTGSVYTRNPAKIRWAADEVHVGNLYFNRKCTGAVVGVHPFGGFNMSGTDSKAGGRDYYLLHTQAKCISEVIPKSTS